MGNLVKKVQTFDHLWLGKCSTLEVHVMYDTEEKEVDHIVHVYAMESKYTYKDGARAEDVPYAIIDLTQVFNDFFPSFEDDIKDMDWSEPQEDDPTDNIEFSHTFDAIATICNGYNNTLIVNPTKPAA